MPAIKLQKLNCWPRQQQHLSIDWPGEIERLEYSCWHSATNYLKSYCRIQRQGVNNSKTLCWLTLTLILLSRPSGSGTVVVSTAVGNPASSAVAGVAALEIGTCKQALGMESGAIADFQITASSAHDMGNVGPQHAR
ncbi:GH10733 [Drosophila grimshawi]|uniref:GH10733 n=2 Tax=Drosophila grimshawi TaxID=7222 RepID=B4JBR3_DROGR|nr:GH10733 [Drosophila grimshawi]